MSGAIPYQLREAIHEAVALQREWLTVARADMEPGQPEPCGASDAYVAWALKKIAPARTVARPRPAPAPQAMSWRQRLAERRASQAQTVSP